MVEVKKKSLFWLIGDMCGVIFDIVRFLNEFGRDKMGKYWLFYFINL